MLSNMMHRLTTVLLVAILGSGVQFLNHATSGFNVATEEFPFKCNAKGNLWCAGDASTTSEGILHLTPNERNQSDDFYYNSFGMALFSSPIHMLSETGLWMSFSTHFTFKIEPKYQDFPGDGLAFVMLRENRTGSPGAAFGAYGGDGWQRVETMAVEFDTFQNMPFGDLDRNHVGVDLENIRSKVARNAHYAGIVLAGSEAIYAWIDYHAKYQSLNVRISLDHRKPKDAFIELPISLSNVFGDDGTVYVGFSGSNGLCTCHNFYSIYDWNFQVYPDDGGIVLLIEVLGGILTLVVVIVVLVCARMKKNSYISLSRKEFDLKSSSERVLVEI
ncbi:hypothetical protein MPTK1_5g05610 [Marchantia polymorpha subsp. ruderalis]|uniref:Legume lectin domain-containing protein n=2 Tax=Marchantia polymorpha TaxID=3197 RepID=A0AAF6BFA2_MARPO|nr:hypothetical protein MARPO_0027s0064 [Marchantia polymorpha]BBN10686.1 hypothetical protein Mp_5g05610 [Marchantia polymorpha subsp. ruderalis]PTQ42946.1 hypothetical protein MARPO_0027s0064 [Marchantia polymorpha]PTQ42947.1 hypothetical protein MARPO_0027s0064 [Marchantia polymorpha]BBN10687.1 hypothetical protein Mp_5g05610 [Marchantia polymorpha subsp. ruderalis]|eukprot:PTQ42945.1 hypothetical protein MARPO_0027s0064 [Marchantia polymorpha]